MNSPSIAPLTKALQGVGQKLALICALLIKPKALLVDEPLIGLDPHSIDQSWKVFMEMKADGCSILLSTHIIDMIDDIWDRAYIMHQGEILRVVERTDLSEGQSLKQIFFEVTENAQ